METAKQASTGSGVGNLFPILCHTTGATTHMIGESGT